MRAFLSRLKKIKHVFIRKILVEKYDRNRLEQLLKRNEKRDFYIFFLEGERYIDKATHLKEDRLLKEGIDFISGFNYRRYIDYYKKYGSQEWRENEYWDKDWRGRVDSLLNYLDLKSTTTILDIGCGEMRAKEWLRVNKLDIEYYGLDYQKRDDDTIVCDLNKKEFPQKCYDCFLVSGCLEYIEDTDWFFECLSRCNKQVLLSYCTMERGSDILGRKSLGWKNHLTLVDIMVAMKRNGFILHDTEDRKNNLLMDFRRV